MNTFCQSRARWCMVTMATLISLSVLGCRTQPRLDVVALSDVDGRLVFDIFHKSILGLDRIKVLNENGDLIWDIDSLPDKGQLTWERIAYGVIPSAGAQEHSPPRQVYPLENAPPEAIQDKIVRVVVEYTYDADFAPHSGAFEKWIHIP
jgi:hypothetical protein